MPQTKFQDFIYTVIMVPVMVYAMVCYNIALDRGALSNFVLRAALSELPLMCLIAFVLEFFLIGRVAQKAGISTGAPGAGRAGADHHHHLCRDRVPDVPAYEPGGLFTV